jgi:hypothetical protein
METTPENTPQPPSVPGFVPLDAELQLFALRSLQKGTRATSVKSDLVNKGADPDEAWAFVSGLSNRMEEAKSQEAKKDIRNGGLWLAGGLLVTLVTYSMASNGGGGSYVVTWGAIIFGGIQLVRGLMNSH